MFDGGGTAHNAWKQTCLGDTVQTVAAGFPKAELYSAAWHDMSRHSTQTGYLQHSLTAHFALQRLLESA